jgi:predicted outer membrane repeat protein
LVLVLCSIVKKVKNLVNHEDQTCSLNVASTLFEQNGASVKGGAISYNFYKPILGEGVVFIENSAPYGPDVAGYPLML